MDCCFLRLLLYSGPKNSFPNAPKQLGVLLDPNWEIVMESLYGRTPDLQSRTYIPGLFANMKRAI
jgi:hypothetical protein